MTLELIFQIFSSNDNFSAVFQLHSKTYYANEQHYERFVIFNHRTSVFDQQIILWHEDVQCKVCLQSILADTLKTTRHELGQFKKLHKHSTVAMSPCWYNLSLSRLLPEACFYVNMVIHLFIGALAEQACVCNTWCKKQKLQHKHLQDHMQTPGVWVQLWYIQDTWSLRWVHGAEL